MAAMFTIYYHRFLVIPRSTSFRFFNKNPSFSFTTKPTSLNNAEKFYTHLLKHPQNPEKTLSSCISGAHFQLDAQCVTHVLNRCCSLNDKPQFQLGLRFFIWSGLQSNYKHSKHMYNLACKLFEIPQNPSRIRDLFEAYRLEGCATNNVKLFKVVFNLCKQAMIPDEALWVLRNMEEFQCKPDSTVFNVVIRLFCEKGDLDMAMELMREMEVKYELCPDMITYMVLLKGFCNAGRLDDACMLLKAMRNHQCTPNLVAYSALLDGLCRFGSLDRALELLGEMEKEGGGECTPNVITYTSVIQSFCEKGKSIEALSLLDRMKKRECSPNRVTISVLLEGLCAQGHVDEAYKLVDRLVAGDDVSSSDCYSSLVISLSRIKRFEEAEKLLKWMLDSQVRPDGMASSILMRNLCMQERFLDAFNLCEAIDKTNCAVTMDSDLYSLLLAGLCQQNHKDEVTKLASLMVDKGIQLKMPLVRSFNEYLNESIDTKTLSNLYKLKKSC